MTTLKLSTLTMPAALLGQDNPLPQLVPQNGNRPGLRINENVPEELRTHLGYGVGTGVADECLPYTVQDNYSRERSPQPFKVAVLENEFLRATILLEQGGRLWSLYHKPSKRELIEVNPVFQPGNLAIRNAWYSGGVEWNCGVRGHTPLGCSPMFAAEVTHPDGWPVLRLWEFERIRAVPYQLDFMLPPGSPFLHVRVGLSNPHQETIPLYWWSNMAVADSPKIRVLTPAQTALTHNYGGGLQLIPVPVHESSDLSYPQNSPNAADYFYVIPKERRPWITALDKTGSGVVQTSTAGLPGRKLFVWGTGQGGDRWQEFLSQDNHRYIEIQAGVARTQYESFPMLPHSRLSWMEAYGLMEADPDTVHGNDFDQAVAAVEDRLEKMLPANELNRFLESTDALFDKAPEKILQRGAGWGALEAIRREHAGEAPLATPGIIFDEASLDQSQQPWLDLLRTGRFPEGETPGSWMLQPEWRALLEASPNDHWLAWLHRGVMRHQTGDTEGAKMAWENSLQHRRTAHALRNLAKLSAFQGEAERAASLMGEAYKLAPDLAPLLIEYLQALLAASRSADALALIQSLPASVSANGRVRALYAKSALAEGLLPLAAQLLADDLVVPDIQECDTLLSDLWYELKLKELFCEQKGLSRNAVERHLCDLPPPSHLDFRSNSSLPKHLLAGIPE